jgi:copper chaperone CopZ
MKKVFKLEDLDCANCAAKLERGVNELPEVKKATVNFMLQKMTLEVEDGISIEELTEKIKKVMKKVVPDCRMI